MKSRLFHWLAVLCLGATLLVSAFQSLAEPAWLCPSYQIVEVTRLHYGGGQPTSEIFPYPSGLGANSQVVYNTGWGAGGLVRHRLWQPQAQFGRPAGSSILAEGAYGTATGFAGAIGTGVTSDGRFAEVSYLINGSSDGFGLRWWDGFKWISLMWPATIRTFQ